MKKNDLIMTKITKFVTTIAGANSGTLSNNYAFSEMEIHAFGEVNGIQD
jgi:hypothetical protein